MKQRSTILLIGLSIIAFSVRQQFLEASSFSNWQTYRNAKYGYEVRYPDEIDLWPTGLPEERDGRAIRIAQKEYAAAVPILDIYVQAEIPCVESLSEGELKEMNIFIEDVEINGIKGQEVTYQWKSNGEIVFVNLCIRDVLFQFDAQPGLHDFHQTVWWKIISTFRLQEK